MQSKFLTGITIVALSAIFITSCKKENKSDKPSSSTAKTIEKRTLNTTEVALKKQLEQISFVVAEVLKDKTLKKGLDEQIASKLKITTNDEALSFKELFGKPSDQAALTVNPSVKKFTIDPIFAQNFKNKYLEVLYSGNYKNADKFQAKSATGLKVNDYDPNNPGGPLEQIVGIDGGQLYFPYSENFLVNTYNINPNAEFTISSHPIDNADENGGFAYNASSGTWDPVLVDDTYAWNTPTYIVTIDDGPTPENVAGTGQKWEFLPIEGGPTAPPPGMTSPTFSLVYWGKLHISRQAEGLFDGASEIVLYRPTATPQLDENGELKTVDMGVGSFVSVPPIKRKRIWQMYRDYNDAIMIGGNFMSDWKVAYQEVPLVIYEFDRGAHFSIEIPLNIKLKKGNITVGGKLSADIRSRKTPYIMETIDRDQYFAMKHVPDITINPGALDGWRQWGVQMSSVTLIQQGSWSDQYNY